MIAWAPFDAATLGRLWLGFNDQTQLLQLTWQIPDHAAKRCALPTVWQQSLTHYFSGDPITFAQHICFQAALNIDTATPFQQRVWQALYQIPYGHTLSYGALARRLKSSAQAIGQACAKNPIPIIIPCHRVITAQGQLGGYSGGHKPSNNQRLKQQLLALEGVFLHD